METTGKVRRGWLLGVSARPAPAERPGGPVPRPPRVLLLDIDAPQSFLVARCLKAGGATLFGVGRAVSLVLRHGSSFRAVAEADWSDEAQAFRDVGALCRRWSIDVALPVGVGGWRLLARRHDGLPAEVATPPAPSSRSIDIADDKRRFALFLREHRLPHPPTFVPGVDDPRKLRELPARVLLKPARSAGGVGIRRVADADALSPDSLAQAEVEGVDYGVNLLCEGGRVLAATVQRAIEPSSRPFEYASGVEFVDEPELLDLARTLVRALDWSGVANIDFRRETATGRFLILEFNGRFWGSLLGSLSAGVNFPLLACRLALGERPSASQISGLRHFRGQEPILRAFRGGGRGGVRLAETEWRHFRGDARGVAIWLAYAAGRALGISRAENV